jgi:multidrug efflux system outer membrane protein
MRRLAALALVVASVSCTLAPRYERPASPVANQLAGGEGALVAADQGWRSIFGDARLQTLIKLALENNRDLRVAALNVELARAQHRIQRADLFPTVSAGGQATFSNTEAARRYSAGLDASYEIDLFGRVRSLNEAALQDYLSREETHRAAHLALVGEVVTQYLRERAYAEEYELAVRTVASTKEMYDITRRMLEAGQRSELDMRTAETQVQAARADVARLSRLQQQANNALAVLVGTQLPNNLPPPQPLASQQIIADLGVVSSQVLLRRPDVLAAEHTLRAANANIGAARAAFFPTISLTGFAGFASTALANLFSGGLFWTFSPRLSVPLFTGGRNMANLDVAHVRKRIEVARYEQAIQIAFREVADALAARATYEEQLAAQAARTEAERVRFQLSEQRYRAGVESYLIVLDAQRDLYVAETVLIEVRLARLTNLADLYRALGGGWRER